MIAPARDRLANVLSHVEFGVPQLAVFSNASAAPYPDDPQAIAALLAEHLVSPVRFADEVEAMYGAGARIFVEVGPRNVLTGLTKQILGNREHLAVASDAAGRSGLLQLLTYFRTACCARRASAARRLYEGRVVRQLNLAALVGETRDQPLPPTVWLVNGGRARPLHSTARRWCRRNLHTGARCWQRKDPGVGERPRQVDGTPGTYSSYQQMALRLRLLLTPSGDLALRRACCRHA